MRAHRVIKRNLLAKEIIARKSQPTANQLTDINTTLAKPNYQPTFRHTKIHRRDQ